MYMSALMSTFKMCLCDVTCIYMYDFIVLFSHVQRRHTVIHVYIISRSHG